jgi:hypothetical protein
MRPVLIFLITVGLTLRSTAQGNNIKLYSITSAGVTVGQIGTFPSLQTVNGLQYKKWLAGIGVAYDPYYYKTIPLFLDTRKFINKQDNIFVYGDAGYDMPWKNKPKENFSYSSYDFTGGFYGDAGVGYETIIAGKTFLVFSAGYNYKTLYSKVITVDECLVGPCPENNYKYTYNFRRLIFKAGIRF